MKLRKQSVPIGPGIYCGGLTITSGADIRRNPGLYMIKDGAFEVQANASAVGEGVTIAFVGKKATLNLQGGGKMRVTAPNTGAFAGIVLFSESISPYVEWATVSGGATLEYEGTLYLPTHELWINSPSTDRAVVKAETEGHGLIANSVRVQGSADLEVTRIETAKSGEALRFKFGSRQVQ